jgi:hypothetical protein
MQLNIINKARDILYKILRGASCTAKKRKILLVTLNTITAYPPYFCSEDVAGCRFSCQSWLSIHVFLLLNNFAIHKVLYKRYRLFNYKLVVKNAFFN